MHNHNKQRGTQQSNSKDRATRSTNTLKKQRLNSRQALIKTRKIKIIYHIMPSSSSSLLQLQRIVFLLTVTTIALVSFEGMNTVFLSGATRRTASSTSNKFFVNAFTSTPTTRTRVAAASSRFTVTRTMMTAKNVNSNVKPGIASFDELTKFVNDAGTNLVVVDVRNPDESKEPGDQK